MFILKRQDVEIVNVPNPQNKDQQIPILQYQGQTFRLLNMFGDNRDEALSLWRDLTDNKGKACVLLEEPESKRFSVWGKVKLDRVHTANNTHQSSERSLVQGCLLMLQTVYSEIEDFLGTRQATLFKQDMVKVLQKGQFPKADAAMLEQLLTLDPMSSMQIPAWDDTKMQLLLGEMYRLSVSYYGNTSFLESAKDSLNELSPPDRTKFINWLKLSPKGKLWQ